MPDDVSPLTAEEQAALAALAGAATPGPWEWNSYDGIFSPPPPDGDAEAIAWIDDVPNPDERHGDELHTEQGRANALFIAACREALPRLLATCAALEAALREYADFNNWIGATGPFHDEVGGWIGGGKGWEKARRALLLPQLPGTSDAVAKEAPGG